MAITNAQQYRQMYKEGSEKPAMQGGGPNYLGKQPEVTTPRKWKSSPDHPDTELAYITEPEKQVLISLNMHGGLEDGKANKGPNNIPSLQGDLGGYDASPGGPNDSGNRVGETDKNKQRASDIMTGKVNVTSKTGVTEGYKGYQPNRRQYDGIGDFYGNPTIGDRIGKGLSNLFANTLIGRIASKFGPLNNLEFYNQKVVPAGKTNLNYEDYMKARMAGEIDAYGNPISQDNDGNNVLTMEQLLAQQNAAQQQSNTTDPVVDTDPAIPYRLMAEGGIMDSMDEDIRQQLFLGGVAKGIKKAVKGATRAVKKIAKSPVGKAALLYAGGSYLSGMGAFGGLKGAGIFKPQAIGLKNLIMGKPLGFKTFGDTVARSGGLLDFFSGMSGAKKAALGIGALSALPLLGIGTGDDEEEGEAYRGEGLDIAGIRRNPYLAMQRSGNPYRLMAEGGDTEDAEPVAKKTMPLLDMGGKEKDYRETGGFVDMGRMEKADDVPARLSKNEFVFTADAVRNAGEGDIDKGAEVMYNMMKNLESGGEVSEESQGLEGAKEMFQTSQRLEGVM